MLKSLKKYFTGKLLLKMPNLSRFTWFATIGLDTLKDVKKQILKELLLKQVKYILVNTNVLNLLIKIEFLKLLNEKIFILTGEPSGDKLASEVIKELKNKNDIEYLSVGGQYLIQLVLVYIWSKKITYSFYWHIAKYF